MVQEQELLYNDDELLAPEWMTTEYLEKILRDAYNDDSIKVHDAVTKPGSNKNDHYASVMFRVNITYSTNDAKNLEKSLIVKIMPFVEGTKKELMTGVNMFEVEIKMYKEVIPKFEKMLKEIGDPTRLGGKCLYAASEPREVLIFEDLTKENFTSVDNWGGSWELAVKGVEKLAKWHAMSYKLVSEGDVSLHSFSKNAYTHGNMVQTPLFKNSYKNFVNMLKRYPELEIYAEKFEALSTKDPFNKSIDVFRAFLRGEHEHLYVLNHGDFHVKNLMFTETEPGHADEVLLVDFQLCIWGPAIVDLTYMLYMMLDNESRLSRREELIHYYFSVLTETLQKLKFSGEYPKLTDLYKDFITFKDFELMMLTSMLPFITAIIEDPTIDIGFVMSNEEAGKALYEGETIIKYVKKVLPDFLHKGYLD